MAQPVLREIGFCHLAKGENAPGAVLFGKSVVALLKFPAPFPLGFLGQA
jgi:hypothetical protein